MAIVPKITAIDSSLLLEKNSIATLKDDIFDNILQEICHKFEC